jgi:predicted dehydrogenase
VIHIALIGAGSIAGTHARAANPEHLTITAAVDLNADAARNLAAQHGAAAFGSVDELLDAIAGGLKADAVLLCTPPSVRLRVLEKTATRGLHALIEKPVATDAAEGEKIARLASSHPDLVFAMGFCHRFTPAIQTMRALVGEGRVGRLIRFENTFAFHHPPMREKWFSDPEISGGGALMDAGCHSIDLFHFLVGPSESAGAVLDTPWPGRGESGATALLRCNAGTHKGVCGVVVSGWMEGEKFEVRLVGEGGTLAYDYMKPTELHFSPVTGAAEVIPVETHDVRFTRQLSHFASVCANPSEINRRAPMAGVAEGVAAARTIGRALSRS